MTTLFFAYQDAGLLHKVQMSGDNRPILGHIFRDAPDIGPAVQHKKLQYLNSNRFAQGFKKF
jgi:hypothetical protein